RLCLTARGLPASIAPPISGAGGTPVNCRSILIRRQTYAVQTKEPMDKTYQPHAIESSWYQTWEQNNYFAPQGSGESYTIALPPPNVTGSLHMGHGFNNSIMDALIRFRRMQGRNTLWQPGTDHAGIATQMVVE